METQPHRIGKYRIDRMLGRGGMGQVYVGVDPDLDRSVAIKIVSLESDRDARARFIREAKTMARLSHQNIVTLLEYGVEGDKPYLVMELLGGEDLNDWLRSPHSLRDYLRVMHDIAQAIQAAHEAGILHRDIKPENIRVLANGHCKLLDFGIANRANEGHLTESGAFVGTMNYVPPEVVSGLRHCAQSDIYSLALLYYTMLAGHNPFSAETVPATLARVLHYTPPSLDKVRDGIPGELVRLIDQCLKKNPLQRPASSAVLVETLRACLDRADSNAVLGPLKIDTARLETPTQPPTRLATALRRARASGWRNRRWALAALAIALAGVWTWRAWPPGAATTERAPASSVEPAAPPTARDARPPTPASESPEGTRGGAEEAPAVEPKAVADTAKQPPAVASSPAPRQKTAPGREDRARTVEPAPERPSRPPPEERPPPGATMDAAASSAAPDRAPAEEPRIAGRAPAADAAAPPPIDSTIRADKPPVRVPERAPPVIASASTQVIRRGIPVTLTLRGENLSRATAASVLLGRDVDDRFRISDLRADGDAMLSLRIEAPRNLPLGRYALVLESADGRSAPFMLEVSL